MPLSFACELHDRFYGSSEKCVPDGIQRLVIGFSKALLGCPIAFDFRNCDRVFSKRLEKRSQALRGRNLARDIQDSGAPMAPRAPCLLLPTGALFVTSTLDIRAMPNKSCGEAAPWSVGTSQVRISRMNRKMGGRRLERSREAPVRDGASYQVRRTRTNR